ncbi:hypothetical protein [Methylobacterium soli]|uniref:Uncharacterized protein n=1 Tax=Methylobacterium soli TaxID=553447 RepID=A0A6L3SQC8_9HYPH|nr:hypothetical protein [Methylobacterium soli]KAB1068610.1 hypothetical protein F6X53_31475 [Methylobacterium soli]GJE44008.1 hypothetical protein AEGHOMDF_3194 [Methylobacterium soli]
MDLPDTSNVGHIALTAQRLYERLIKDSVTERSDIWRLLRQLTPDMNDETRRAVMELVVASAESYLFKLSNAKVDAAANWVRVLEAQGVQHRWVAFDLRVCLGLHPDHQDKDRLRMDEIELLRPSLAGICPMGFGRLFQEQLAREPKPPRND